MSSAKEKHSALLAYSILLLVAILGAYAFYELSAASVRSVQHMLGPEAVYPAGFRLFLSLQPYLTLLPAIVIILGIASWRVVHLRHPVVISILSSMITVSYLAMGILMSTPQLSYAGLPSFPKQLIEQLNQAESITLYSLGAATNASANSRHEQFLGQNVITQVAVTNDALRRKVVEALVQGSLQNTGIQSGCFIPRHGLHATSQGKTIDLLICFECLKVEHHPAGEFYFISREPSVILNQVLGESTAQ
jgi:hypothetical protein